MPNESATIIQKLWNFCNVLRDDGVSYDVTSNNSPICENLEAALAQFQNIQAELEGNY